MALFHERLSYLGTRFKALNGIPVTYVIKERNGDEVTFEIALASPILLPPDEQIPGLPITRLEFQDWCIDVVDLGDNFPPQTNHYIRKANGEEFQATPTGMDNPLYQFLTSTRDRVRIHTVRTKLADEISDLLYLTADDVFIVVDAQYGDGINDVDIIVEED